MKESLLGTSEAIRHPLLRDKERLSERLAVVREWAEMNPYAGIHDAPYKVRRALGYTGKGAKILAARFERNRCG